MPGRGGDIVLLVGVIRRDGVGATAGGSRLVFQGGGVALVAAASRLGAVDSVNMSDG